MAAHRDYLRRWLPWLDGIESEAQSLAFIQGALARERQGAGRTRLVEYRGELSGVVGFNSIDAGNRSCEIGYWLSEDRQGCGIMTHCVGTLVEQAFSELHLHRVVIRAAPGNRASRAIPERLGFVQEGVLREAEWLYDHFVDGVLYALLRREWTGWPRA